MRLLTLCLPLLLCACPPSKDDLRHDESEELPAVQNPNVPAKADPDQAAAAPHAASPNGLNVVPSKPLGAPVAQGNVKAAPAPAAPKAQK